MPTLEEVIQQLPPDLRKDVQQYAESLLKKRRAQEKRRSEEGEHYLRLDWAGGLRDYKDQYTALELQKKAVTEWRGD